MEGSLSASQNGSASIAANGLKDKIRPKFLEDSAAKIWPPNFRVSELPGGDQIDHWRATLSFLAATEEYNHGHFNIKKREWEFRIEYGAKRTFQKYWQCLMLVHRLLFLWWAASTHIELMTVQQILLSLHVAHNLRRFAVDLLHVFCAVPRCSAAGGA